MTLSDRIFGYSTGTEVDRCCRALAWLSLLGMAWFIDCAALTGLRELLVFSTISSAALCATGWIALWDVRRCRRRAELRDAHIIWPEWMVVTLHEQPRLRVHRRRRPATVCACCCSSDTAPRSTAPPAGSARAGGPRS